MLSGVPNKGKLSAKQVERVRDAARAMSKAGDPQAVELFVRAGDLAAGAEEARKNHDLPQAAQLFAIAIPPLAKKA